MKLTRNEIVELNSVIQQNKSVKLPIKFSYAIRKNDNKVMQATTLILESVNDIKIKNAKKDVDGKPIVKNGQYEWEDSKAYNKEINSFMNEQEEIDIYQCTQADLQGITIEPSLLPVVKEE